MKKAFVQALLDCLRAEFDTIKEPHKTLFSVVPD